MTEFKGWFKDLTPEQLKKYRRVGIVCYKCNHRSGVERDGHVDVHHCGYCNELVWV